MSVVDCAKDPSTFVLLEYRAGAMVGQTPLPEVQDTQSYKDLAKVETIALKFPDSCRTEGAATATGTANVSSGIMGTNCGVWLAELERSLTEHHYRVISWSALRQMQETKLLSTYDAAIALGAQVVFVVNSMETHTIERGSAAGASYRYFKSNRTGDALGKLAPDERDRPVLKSFAASHAGTALDPKEVIGLAATLDVTAVNAKGGESLWFFRHSLSEASAAATGMRFLFARMKDEDELTAVKPEGLPVVVAAANHNTEDVEKSSIATAPENLHQAELHKLARQVADECVVRFSSKVTK